MYNTFLLKYCLSIPYKYQPEDTLNATEMTPTPPFDPLVIILPVLDHMPVKLVN